MDPFPEPRDNVMHSTTTDADTVDIRDQAGSQSARLDHFTGMDGTETDEGMEPSV